MNVNLIVFVVAYCLFLLSGFGLVLELINGPTLITLLFHCALTSGFYGIQKMFKIKAYPKKKSKFKSNFRKRI